MLGLAGKGDSCSVPKLVAVLRAPGLTAVNEEGKQARADDVPWIFLVLNNALAQARFPDLDHSPLSKEARAEPQQRHWNRTADELTLRHDKATRDRAQCS